jgi:hypothetical protein
MGKAQGPVPDRGVRVIGSASFRVSLGSPPVARWYISTGARCATLVYRRRCGLRTAVTIGLTIAALAFLSSQVMAAPKACDADAVAAAQAAIAAACPCDGQTAEDGSIVPWERHGQYVRCVAHTTRDQIANSAGALSRRCLRTSVRCAARSTCGKPDAVACRLHDDCVGDSATGDGTADGSCASDAALACDTSSDCPVLRCGVRRSADLCTAQGGEGSPGSCCD